MVTEAKIKRSHEREVKHVKATFPQGAAPTMIQAQLSFLDLYIRSKDHLIVELNLMHYPLCIPCQHCVPSSVLVTVRDFDLPGGYRTSRAPTENGLTEQKSSRFLNVMDLKTKL